MIERELQERVDDLAIELGGLKKKIEKHMGDEAPLRSEDLSAIGALLRLARNASDLAHTANMVAAMKMQIAEVTAKKS